MDEPGSPGKKVSGHPDVDHGKRAVLTGTSYLASGVLFGLSAGHSVREIQGKYRTAQGPDPTPEQITNAVRYAALLAKDVELAPPEAAGWMRSESASMEELAEMREQAASALEEIAERLSKGELVDTGESERSRPLALSYGAALLSYHELPALEAEPAEEVAFRAALIPEDRALIEGYFRYRLPYSYLTTPEYQLGRWQRQIEELEDDEAEIHVPDEYTNELAIRDILEDAITLLSPASAGAVEEMIRPLDRRFEAATEHSLALIPSDRPWEPRRWWHYRVPKRRNKEWTKWRQEMSIASLRSGPTP